MITKAARDKKNVCENQTAENFTKLLSAANVIQRRDQDNSLLQVNNVENQIFVFTISK